MWLVFGREWNGVADVRQSYWRTPDEVEVMDPSDEAGTDAIDTDEADVVEAAPADAVTDEVTREEAEQAWVPVAHEILTRVAGTYQALIDHSELAAEVQATSGVHTRKQVRSWIGPVLTAVARGNHERQEPPLTSLVVHKSDGTTGVGFDEVVRLAGDEALEDPMAREKLAAQARLECYQWAGAQTPAGGGRPLLSPRFEQVHARLRKERRAAEQPTICGTCFMAIPPTGVCDNCG